MDPVPPPSPERFAEGFHVGQQVRPLAADVAAAAPWRSGAGLEAWSNELPPRLLADAHADRPPENAEAVTRWARLGVHDLLSAEGRDGCAVRTRLPPGGSLRAPQLRALAALAQRLADGCVHLLPGAGIELWPVAWREVPELFLAPQQEQFAEAGLEPPGLAARTPPPAQPPPPAALRELPQGQSRLILRVPGARCLSHQIETLAALTDTSPGGQGAGGAAVHFVVDRHDAGKVLVVISGLWNTQIDAARAALAAADFAAL